MKILKNRTQILLEILNQSDTPLAIFNILCQFEEKTGFPINKNTARTTLQKLHSSGQILRIAIGVYAKRSWTHTTPAEARTKYIATWMISYLAKRPNVLYTCKMLHRAFNIESHRPAHLLEIADCYRMLCDQGRITPEEYFTLTTKEVSERRAIGL